MAKSVETATRNYARGALRAFIEGTITINQAVGMIRSSGVRGPRLIEVFENLKKYGNASRYNEALGTCREKGWLD